MSGYVGDPHCPCCNGNQQATCTCAFGDSSDGDDGDDSNDSDEYWRTFYAAGPLTARMTALTALTEKLEKELAAI